MNDFDRNSPIGVFDSGLGGLSVLKQAAEMLPNEDFIYIGDSMHNPYGTKTPDQISEYCNAICDWFASKRVKAVVIACNTATSACVNDLRNKYDFPIIGMEPALKVAATQKPGGTIAVWATKLTLQEKKFQALEQRFDESNEIVEVPAGRLVELVENQELFDPDKRKEALDDYLKDSKAKGEPDAVVLGCTHFVFFKDALKEHPEAPELVVDGNEGTVRHLKDVLEKRDLESEKGSQHVWISNTDPDKIKWSLSLYELTGGQNGQETECVADIFR